MRKIYMTCIRPSLEYAAVARSALNAGGASRLESVQRHATRLISGLPRSSNTPHDLPLVLGSAASVHVGVAFWAASPRSACIIVFQLTSGTISHLGLMQKSQPTVSHYGTVQTFAFLVQKIVYEEVSYVLVFLRVEFASSFSFFDLLCCYCFLSEGYFFLALPALNLISLQVHSSGFFPVI